MTRIACVLAVPTVGAGYCQDLAALEGAHIPLPEQLTATPLIPGFRKVREVAEAVSVGVVLDDGRVAWGDCVGVAHAGQCGREPLFRADLALDSLRQGVIPWLEGRRLIRFRELAAELDSLTEPVEITRTLPAPPQPEPGEGVSRRDLITAPARLFRPETEAEETPTERVTVQRPLHAVLRYGVSQALLQAVALVRGMTPAELITEEWALPGVAGPLPLYVESRGDHHRNAERMILHRLDSLGHSLGDDASTDTSDLPELELGSEGAKLSRYIRWLAERVRELGGADYRPTFHLDLHGALGQICENNAGRMLGQLYAWQLAAGPHTLRLESPMLRGSREEQIEAMKTLRGYRQFRKMTVELVADEWANTLEDVCAFLEAGAADMIHVTMPDLGSIHNAVEAVLACKAAGVAVVLGGSQVETDLSARASLQVALATQPDLVMAKPGLDVDAAISLAQNEMARALAEIHLRQQE